MLVGQPKLLQGHVQKQGSRFRVDGGFVCSSRAFLKTMHSFWHASRGISGTSQNFSGLYSAAAQNNSFQAQPASNS